MEDKGYLKAAVYFPIDMDDDDAKLYRILVKLGRKKKKFFLNAVKAMEILYGTSDLSLLTEKELAAFVKKDIPSDYEELVGRIKLDLLKDLTWISRQVSEIPGEAQKKKEPQKQGKQIFQPTQTDTEEDDEMFDPARDNNNTLAAIQQAALAMMM